MTDAISAAVHRMATRHAERQLSVEEARAYLSTPVSDTEREDVLALVDWFRKRYPRAPSGWRTSDARMRDGRGAGNARGCPCLASRDLMSYIVTVCQSRPGAARV